LTWIGVGVVYPASAMAWRRGAESPKESNDMGIFLQQAALLEQKKRQGQMNDPALHLLY
jgi:hypothetical protein